MGYAGTYYECDLKERIIRDREPSENYPGFCLYERMRRVGSYLVYSRLLLNNAR